MTWMGKHAPAPVTILQIERGMSSDKLLWYGAKDYSGGDYLLYNIYASDSWPVDTEDPRNLIATRHRGQSLQVPHHGHALYYAVTATDRYGNESASKQEAGVRRQETGVRKRRKPCIPISVCRDLRDRR